MRTKKENETLLLIIFKELIEANNNLNEISSWHDFRKDDKYYEKLELTKENKSNLERLSDEVLQRIEVKELLNCENS